MKLLDFGDHDLLFATLRATANLNVVKDDIETADVAMRAHCILHYGTTLKAFDTRSHCPLLLSLQAVTTTSSVLLRNMITTVILSVRIR